MTVTTRTTNPVTRAAVLGAASGVAASLAMAMYAMIASWHKDTGFFSPLYHIASLWTPASTMMTSMRDAMGGNAFYFVLGPAILGAIIHMTTGAGYGAIFGAVASRLPLSRWALAGAGLVYGAAVFVMSAFVALPAAAAVFGSGNQIADMARMAGYGTFLAEHLVFGLVLGLLVPVAAARYGRVEALGERSAAQ